MERVRNFIGGEWVEPTTGKYGKDTSPARPTEVICEYALGGEEYTWAELQGMAGKYVECARLAKAIQEEHRAGIRRRMQAKAEEQARSHRPNPFTDYSYSELVTIARNTPEVVREAAEGRKITAIKELRNVSGCSLRDAKLAVEGLQAEQRADTAAEIQRRSEALGDEQL